MPGLCLVVLALAALAPPPLGADEPPAAEGDAASAPSQQERMTARGFIRHRGAWRTPQEIELIERAERVTVAQKQWNGRLESMRRRVDDPSAGAAAAEALGVIRDPLAVPALAAALAGSRVRRLGQSIDPQEAHGEFIGLALFSARGTELVRETWRDLRRNHRGRFHEAESLDRASLTDLVQELVDRGHEVTCVDVYKGWMEIDSFDDYRRAWAELRW